MQFQMRRKVVWLVWIASALVVGALAGCRSPTPAPQGINSGASSSALNVTIGPPARPPLGGTCGSTCETGADCPSGFTCQVAGLFPTGDAMQCWAPSCGGGGGSCGAACNTNMDCAASLSCSTLPGQAGKFCNGQLCEGLPTGCRCNGTTRICPGSSPVPGASECIGALHQPTECHCAGTTLNCTGNAPIANAEVCTLQQPPGECRADCSSNADCAHGFSCQPVEANTLDGYLVQTGRQCWADSCIAAGGAQGAACGPVQPCAVGLTCTPGAGGSSTCQPTPPPSTGAPAPGMCGSPCDPYQICLNTTTPADQCTDWAIHPPILGFEGGPAYYRCLDANNDHMCDDGGGPCADASHCSLNGCGSYPFTVCSSYTAPYAGCVQGTCQQGANGQFTCGGAACLAVPSLPVTLQAIPTLPGGAHAEPPPGATTPTALAPEAPSATPNCFCEVDPSTNAWDGNWVCADANGTQISSNSKDPRCPLPSGGSSGGKGGKKPTPCPITVSCP